MFAIAKPTGLQDFRLQGNSISLPASAMEAMLLLAGLMADHFANSDKTSLEQLEAAREGCRILCLQVGLGPHTACLGQLWCSITAAQVRMQGLAGDDVGLQSMGVPSRVSSFDTLNNLNCYQKFFLHKELKTLEALLPVFQKMAPELIQEVSQVLDKVFEALAMDG
jgi:hypothetical protein